MSWSPDDAEALFSAAYDRELSEDDQRAFDAALAEHPEIAERYRTFCQTFDMLKGSDPAKVVPAPDLLRGVQRRLRRRSAGRFYADRFSERSGAGTRALLVSLLVSCALLALCWIAYRVLVDVHVQ